jgi:hypothetical protein
MHDSFNAAWEERFAGRSFVFRTPSDQAGWQLPSVQIIMRSVQIAEGEFEEMGFVICIGDTRQETTIFDVSVAKRVAIEDLKEYVSKMNQFVQKL